MFYLFETNRIFYSCPWKEVQVLEDNKFPKVQSWAKWCKQYDDKPNSSQQKSKLLALVSENLVATQTIKEKDGNPDSFLGTKKRIIRTSHNHQDI